MLSFLCAVLLAFMSLCSLLMVKELQAMEKLKKSTKRNKRTKGNKEKHTLISKHIKKGTLLLSCSSVLRYAYKLIQKEPEIKKLVVSILIAVKDFMF